MSKNIIHQVKYSIALFALLFSASSVLGQKTERNQPRWFFGESVGMNLNYYRGISQNLNETTLIPVPFQKGEGIKPYASLFVEYKPYKKWGFLLNAAYDNRGGTFKDVIAPCNCPASLSTNLSYVAVEPSLKFVPFGSHFYVFGGPTFLFNINKEFVYKQLYQPEVHANYSQVRESIIGAQAGAGVDIPLSAKGNLTQIVLSPFASFQTDLGATPRSIENWSIYTVRVGVALKIGAVKVTSTPVKPIYIVRDLRGKKKLYFSVRAPKLIAPFRHVQEVMPLRNSIFFNLGSSDIPARYKQLSTAEATTFTEAQMVQNAPDDLGEGRSGRQMAIYHQILNITGDRMRADPKSTVFLVGSSDNNPAVGKVMADKVRTYLVTKFRIDSTRITTEGRSHPLIPSEQKGAVHELDLLHEGDRRVDIISNASTIAEPVGNRKNRDLIAYDLNTIPADPLDSQVLFTTENANDLLQSWSIQLTDEKGGIQQFGPFTKDIAAVQGNQILGDNKYGNYKVVMTGIHSDGAIERKESFVSLLKADNDGPHPNYRFSILFEFDQSKSIATYENFLTKIVGPYLTDQSNVTIHGHTDIIGDEKHNQKLSEERAMEVKRILAKYAKGFPDRRVQFEVLGLGEQEALAPFDNKFPEERFYNRCVIIDISPTNP